MHCPFCGAVEDKVIDSRASKDGEAIRRRRECLGCKQRYTTYERVGDIYPMVVKKDGRRERFDRNKILNGLLRACEKRPISVDRIEAVVAKIESKINEMGESEISSQIVGQEIMERLQQLDPVAYVRFASVYKEFKDVGQFMSEIKTLTSEPLSAASHP